MKRDAMDLQELSISCLCSNLFFIFVSLNLFSLCACKFYFYVIIFYNKANSLWRNVMFINTITLHHQYNTNFSDRN